LSRLTSYRDIKKMVLDRIQSGAWPPGALIPRETELATEFGCARATINRALRELAQAGVLERRRKAGTRVSMTPVRKATLDIPLIRQEVEESGATHRHRLLICKMSVPPTHIAARMGLPLERTTLHVQTLHMADSAPYCLEDRWINPRVAPEALSADFAALSANEWLVQNIPISAGEIAFLAENASDADAEILNAAPGAALFVVERLTRIAQEAVTHVRIAYRPGYRMTTGI